MCKCRAIERPLLDIWVEKYGQYEDILVRLCPPLLEAIVNAIPYLCVQCWVRIYTKEVAKCEKDVIEPRVSSLSNVGSDRQRL